MDVERPWNLARFATTLTPSILCVALIRSHLEYAIQAPSVILSRECSAVESVHKLVVKFAKGLRHVQYETALQWLRLLSLVGRRIRSDLTCIYNIMHGLLDFPCDTVFATPTSIGLRGYTNSGVKSVTANMFSAFA